jgi:flagellar biosynthesis protein FlhA
MQVTFNGIVPGLPAIPFFMLSIITIGIGYMAQGVLTDRQKQAELDEIPEEPAPVDTIEGYLHVDPLEVEIGYSLIPMIDQNQDGDLLESITMIRKQIAQEYGIVVPPIRIRDNVQLNSSTYVIKIRGNEIARGEVMSGYYLALTPDGDDNELDGIKTVDPTYNLPAYWLNSEQKDKAELKGYAVVEASAVISTHLMEVLKQNAFKILDRQSVQHLLDNLKESHTAVVEELVPNLLTIGTVQNVLRNLLKENIPIRDLATILEVLADKAPLTRDPAVLTEYVRVALNETITNLFKNDQGEIVAMTLDARLEEFILNQMVDGKQPSQNLNLSPVQMNEIYQQASERLQATIAAGDKAVLVTGPSVRRFVKRFFEPVLAKLPVLSISELLPYITINTIGSIGLQNYD